MNLSTLVSVISLTSLIFFVIISARSMSLDESLESSAHVKRWTFNTWRLHGRRHTPATPLNLSNDKAQQLLNTASSDENDPFKLLERLLRFFQILEREDKTNNIDGE
jgi:hypothetical protein